MIKHIMADGREVDSVEGMVIPTTGAVAVVYRIVADYAENPDPENERMYATDGAAV